MKYLLILVALLLFSCQSASKSAAGNSSTDQVEPIAFQNLNVSNFKGEMSCDECVVMDVRTPAEIAQGKIENALELNLYEKDFVNKINELDKNKNYYLYCKVGARSSKAAQIMIENGFEKVFNLEGGYDAWKKE